MTNALSQEADVAECSVDGCRYPVFRQQLCQAHMKRKQRGRGATGPIGSLGAAGVPGGIGPGERLSAEELVVIRAAQLAEVDSEDDAAWERARRQVVQAAARWVREQSDAEQGAPPTSPEPIGWSTEAAAQARDLFAEHLVKNLNCSVCKRRWATRVGFALLWTAEPADREHRIVTAKPEQLASLCDRCGLGRPSVLFTFSKSKAPRRAAPQG